MATNFVAVDIALIIKNLQYLEKHTKYHSLGASQASLQFIVCLN